MFIVSTAILLAVYLGSQVLHEAGHALAALLVGYRVRGFVLFGSSAEFARPGRFIRFGRSFGRAATMVTPRRGRIRGWRGIVVYSGGVFVNLVLAVLSAPLSVSGLRCIFRSGSSNGPCVASSPMLPSHLEEILPSHPALWLAVQILFFVNLVAVFTNLVPRVMPGSVSDGKHILDLLRNPSNTEWVVMAKGSVVIDRPRSEVWDFLYEPSNVTQYDDTIVTAYRKPGSPLGVGEIHVNHRRPVPPATEGRVDETEIYEFDPPSLFVFGAAGTGVIRTELRLHAVEPGVTRLSQVAWFGKYPAQSPRYEARVLAALEARRPPIAEELTRNLEAIGRTLTTAGSGPEDAVIGA
ncbi:SRPBCC family protein [Pseudofrankia inefficax]|uniref:Peptidase M50 n=1 Tax=Pseudofrankia inefficax (strain DSM 45817 / CECT 9037 / DDB 130130 / EuI1c) TaxID=298654 RepID=E3J576_PSEI1|nr:SRPBCC family protein [Pseudofrankia inefficax]ADP80674.1 peptidase M50 [Pseudofrankia inefficax]